jgi:hypothetical protein
MLPSKKSKVLVVLLLISGLLSGCGYSVQGSTPSEKIGLVSIPVIKEDDDGILRNSLARAISETGKYKYASKEASAELVIKFENEYVDIIGYEWDVNAATGIELNRLYPDEGRKSVVASVALIDVKTKDPIIEPFKVIAQANYDFVNPVALKDIEFRDARGQKQTTLQYSLGQLDSEEGARSACSATLYQDLAKKILDGLRRAPSVKREKNERR